MYGFDIWKDGLESLDNKKREALQKLAGKYKGKLNEDEMSLGDMIVFEMVKGVMKEGRKS